MVTWVILQRWQRKVKESIKLHISDVDMPGLYDLKESVILVIGHVLR